MCCTMFPFSNQNAKKKTIAEKAREEREQRENQRIKQKKDQIKSQAAVIIQSAYRKHDYKKKEKNQLRILWDTDSGFDLNNTSSNQSATTSSIEILGLAYLLFAFFNSDDPTDKIRFSHLCKIILFTTSSSTTAAKQSAQQRVAPFHLLLLSKSYAVPTQNMMKKILWQCVVSAAGNSLDNAGVSSVTSKSTLYLSGSELRLEIFRGYLQNSIASNNETFITVRRNYVLEDGYRYLGGLTAMRTKGRMIARAVQEGILCDVQFAEFFLSKLSGRAVFLEDLVGLNNELWKNMMFLKRYDGNVEDLGLYFSIDEEINGQITSKELKPGGSHMIVTNENRIQYLYFMADYRLNKQNKEQTKAFIDGKLAEDVFSTRVTEVIFILRPIIELNIINHELIVLIRVISGEDVDWDPSDLRKYSVYQDGYFDQHRCRSLHIKLALTFVCILITSYNLAAAWGLQPQFTVRLVSSDQEQGPEPRLVLEPVKAFFNIGNSRSSKGRLPTSST
ncbi:11388_t:CDS:10, partial [Acaulospora colombiana]